MLPNTLNNPELIQNPKQGNEPQFIKHMSKQSKIFFIILGIILVFILLSTFVLIVISMQNKRINNENQQLDQQGELSNVCTINFQEQKANDTNPLNECEVCDPAYSVVEWKKQSGETLCQNNQGICRNGQCVPKVQPLSLPETATDSSGFSSKPPTK